MERRRSGADDDDDDDANGDGDDVDADNNNVDAKKHSDHSKSAAPKMLGRKRDTAQKHRNIHHGRQQQQKVIQM